MTSKKTEVIFRRPKGSYDDHDPSMWNDNAIIEAYDKAINLKPTDEISPTTPTKNMTRRDTKTPEPLWERSQGISMAQENNQDVDWKVGNKCVAKYNEDDLYYDATITSIDKKNYSCEVEFTGYGNKEIVSIHDIHHENQWKEIGDNLLNDVKKLAVEDEDSTSETESSMIESGTTSSSSTSTNPKQKRHSKKQNNPPFLPFPPPMMGYNSNFAMPPWQNSFVPPMASAMFHNNSSSMENNELSNMLMAWYMAGYQTGYFQGRQKKS